MQHKGGKMQRVIHHRASLACPPEEAYKYFTRNGKLEAWLTVRAEVEAVVGGKYELFWVPEEPEHNATKGCRVTALVQNRLLGFEWKGPQEYEEFMNVADPLTHVVVVFIPVTDGTDVHLLHSGWRQGERWGEARKYFDRAWANALDALQKEVATQHNENVLE
jgi:uncharacterized protein YndB with AHSA1/START domain